MSTTETIKMDQLEKAGLGLQWATFSWFTGAITFFATGKVSAVAEAVRDGISSQPSLESTELNMERRLFGVAALLVWMGYGLTLLRKKKELQLAEPLKTNRELWLQAIKATKKELISPTIVTASVVLNTLTLTSPTAAASSGVFPFLSSIAGSLFSQLEFWHAFQYGRQAHQHTKHLRAIRSLKIQTGEAMRWEDFKASLDNMDEAQEKAIQAAEQRMKKLQSSGFDLDNVSFTPSDWMSRVKKVHQFERISHAIKAAMHILLGLSMWAAFVSGHVFTFGALIIGQALWVTAGGLSSRLLAALFPEKRLLAKLLTPSQKGSYVLLRSASGNEPAVVSSPEAVSA